MLRKFRGKSLKLDKKKDSGDALKTPVPPYCHACGQRTPNQSTFSGFSSPRNEDRSSWNSFSRSDSGYGSSATSSSSSSQRSGAGDSVVSIPAPPSRQGTYSSSIYSNDESTHETVETIPVIVEERYDYEFDLPPRTLSTYSEKFKPKSRYAKLNELPAASPRSLLFPDEFYDLDAGIERVGSQEASRRKKGRWHKGSLSFSRLSMGNMKKP